MKQSLLGLASLLSYFLLGLLLFVILLVFQAEDRTREVQTELVGIQGDAHGDRQRSQQDQVIVVGDQAYDEGDDIRDNRCSLR